MSPSAGVRVWLGFLFGAALISAISCAGDNTSPSKFDESVDPAAGSVLGATEALTFRQVSVGGHSCGVATDDRVYCWGGNLWGQLGDGTTRNRSTPVAVQTALRFRSVSAGGQHTCAVTTDDRAYCWGFGAQGQLGDGTGASRSTPVAVGGGRRFRQVSAGRGHSCAVMRFGRAFCWGSNSSGQLGDGTNSNRSTPVAVHSGRNLFRQVSAGGDFTCGVTTGSLAYCWGGNFDGQLGNGTRVAHAKPAPVFGERLFSVVSAGEFHACGITTQKRAFCWGSNKKGQLGIGSLESRRRLRPVAVTGPRQFETVSAGRERSCGVTAFNTFCWGDNSVGQLGDGTRTDRSAPTTVVGGIQFTGVGTGSAHSCGVSSGGAGYCWGGNAKGELGNGTNDDSAVPVPVAGSS